MNDISSPPEMDQNTDQNGQNNQTAPDHDSIPPNIKPWYHPIISFLGFFLEILQILIIVGVLSFVIRMFIVQPFYILGSSMEPFLHEKELLLIDEISYRFSEPKRGDVVVIEPPRDTRDYIKRIIGLPGEKISINDQGQVLINGQNIQESYLSSDNQKTEGLLELTLGSDEYFVMGDNRKVSNDSRGSINPRTKEADNPWTIHKKDIVGKAFLRWWPFNKISIIHRPLYNLNSSNN